MRINAEIKGSDLVQDINFYGETYADGKVVEKIGELYIVLSEAFWELSDLHHTTKDRQEISAIEINNDLSQMRKDLFMIIAETEDVEMLREILYELGDNNE